MADSSLPESSLAAGRSPGAAEAEQGRSSAPTDDAREQPPAHSSDGSKQDALQRSAMPAADLSSDRLNEAEASASQDVSAKTPSENVSPTTATEESSPSAATPARSQPATLTPSPPPVTRISKAAEPGVPAAIAEVEAPPSKVSADKPTSPGGPRNGAPPTAAYVDDALRPSTANTTHTSTRASTPATVEAGDGTFVGASLTRVDPHRDSAQSSPSGSNRPHRSRSLAARPQPDGFRAVEMSKQPSAPLASAGAQQPSSSSRPATSHGQPAPSTPAQVPNRGIERHTSVSRHSAAARKTVGEWEMQKTLGAGSMGKVKLGFSTITGEKAAIKMIPRHTSVTAAQKGTAVPANGDAKHHDGTPDKPPANAVKDKDGQYRIPPSPSVIEKAVAKDASKEVRTMREGSICLLLHHPYICGMKSMIVYPHWYYMVQEYVNGGQMLDYIISHGRLRERSARKFARQIGSALEYCHANSIVHRDLKIENILISKTGNIKIIDFGLSNVYSPLSQLSTFCGSLYFAAPELLNAKPYVGPEIDVWSFGVVLYVLVCGKVPFDDQSMPALHAKIKRGHVEYPSWLSAECKHLLSRMLVTVPVQRATLQEVLSHPWMVKGFAGPPSSHLPERTPLRVEDLDSEVVKGMVGFEFGKEDEILARLTELLSSDVYISAVKAWEDRRNRGEDVQMQPGELRPQDRPAMRADARDLKRSPTNKRFSGFGFYGKKIAGGINAAIAGVSHPSKSPDDLDPTLTSSGTSSVNGALVSTPSPEMLDPTRGFHPLISIYYLVREKVDRERIYGRGVFASSNLSLEGPPPPPAPAAAYSAAPAYPKSPVQSASGKEVDLATVAPSPRSAPAAPMTPQPRARANGDEYAPGSAPPPGQPPRIEIPQGTRRQQEHSPTTGRARPTTMYDALSSPSPRDRRSIHIVTEKERQEAIAQCAAMAERGDQQEGAGGGGLARRFGSLLGRSSSQSDAEFKRHRARTSAAGTSQRHGTRTTVAALPQVDEAALRGDQHDPDVPLAGSPGGKPVGRASTVGAEAAPTNKHMRGRSMGSPAIADGARPSYMGGDMVSDGEKEELATADGEKQSGTEASHADEAKPVYLKGLFSVQTTSTKPIATLRGDLVRVLDRIGIEHRQVKNGFECAHVPSIDLSTVTSPQRLQQQKLGVAGDDGPSRSKSTIRRRASKLLPSGPRDRADTSQQSLTGKENREQQRQRATSSTSFMAMHQADESQGPLSPTGTRAITDSGPKVTATTTTTHSDLVVRFEVFLVKMPLLPGIHGLQFRRISGNAWHYHMLARRILQEMKL